MDTNVAEITHLKKSFGDNEVLKDISFNLIKGENLVVLGKSGSGKSVLIKCMVGLIEPDEGGLSILGKDILTISRKELNQIRKKIGFLFQSAALYDSMIVRENMEFQLRDSKDLTSEAKESLIITALENVGLSDTQDKMPSELSGGMKKRIGLARAILLNPPIILYDEPTTGLDPITSKEISHLIVEVQKKYTTSSIIITHDIECARITSNRMLLLKDGNILVEGTYKELSESTDEWIKSFFK